MDNIIEGVQEFQAGAFHEQEELFARLKAGQSPDALFITCSDSRVNPNLITQTEPGQLFIMRNAGNIIPPYGAANGGEGATIEYAVLALDIRDIIVCGHSHCGAIKGLLHPESLGEMPLVAQWLRHAEATRLIVKAKYPHLDGDALTTQAARENVLSQIENLQTHPSVAVRLAQGKLKLHGWIYHFETGEVFAYHPPSRRFVPLPDAMRGVGRFALLEHTLDETDTPGAADSPANVSGEPLLAASATPEPHANEPNTMLNPTAGAQP